MPRAYELPDAAGRTGAEVAHDRRHAPRPLHPADARTPRRHPEAVEGAQVNPRRGQQIAPRRVSSVQCRTAATVLGETS
jgi:hypothetical protein